MSGRILNERFFIRKAVPPARMAEWPARTINIQTLAPIVLRNMGQDHSSLQEH